MTTSNKYEDMSAFQTLKYVNDNKILLPDIQREYVWDINEIERLFESIVDGYPIGTCIFWKTNGKTINEEKPNLYYFLRNFVREKSKNEKAPEVLPNDSDYYIVLDGQQRITSLNIAFNGSYTYYKGGRGHNYSHEKSWVKKELYYNLDYYNNRKDCEDEENPKKRFLFLASDETINGNYFKINQLLRFEKLTEFIKFIVEKKYADKCCDDLSILFERLTDGTGKGLIHYYCIVENTYDEALDIFVRVNSTGRKLSKSDLLFSTLIDGWKEGKENIDKIISIINKKGNGFKFSRDYLMRLCLVLVDANTNLKINSLTKDTIQKIRDNWSLINCALDNMSTLLASIGICHENLTSYNSTMPIAYYYYKGGKIVDDNSKKEVKKFLSVSLAKRLFGVASNDALNSTRDALKSLDCKHNKFSLNLFNKINLTGGRTFTVEEKDIDYWLKNYEKGASTYIILSLLYPNLKLSQVNFHQDHCHPYVSFENKNISSLGLAKEKVEDWKKKRNLLPNLQFLEGSENESKNKTPLKKWVEDGNDFKYHPENVSLELKDFDVFFEKRGELIKNELKKIFEIQ